MGQYCQLTTHLSTTPPMKQRICENNLAQMNGQRDGRRSRGQKWLPTRPSAASKQAGAGG